MVSRLEPPELWLSNFRGSFLIAKSCLFGRLFAIKGYLTYFSIIFLILSFFKLILVLVGLNDGKPFGLNTKKNRLMKQIVKAILSVPLLVIAFNAKAQSPIVCPINAGPDQTICAPNCATLTGTFVPTNQTNSYAASLIPYAPDPFNVGTGIVLADDQWSGVIALPFTFCFYGTAYNSCLIGSNGMVSFTTTAANGYCQWPINTPVPTVANPMNTIMGPWQDLYPPGGGTIRYTTYGAAPCRRFVVSWNQLPMFACGTTLCTQQIVLYETTNIIDNFIQSKGSCSWNGGRAIQAIHNVNGTQAVVQAGRNSPVVWTVTNEGRRYTPSGANTSQIAWYQGSTLIGTTASVSVCPTTTTTYTFQATYTNCNNTTVTVSDQVTVNVSTLVTTAGADQNICTGSCTNLTANAVGAIGYSWVTIPGNINVGNTATINVCPTANTTYVVTATNGTCTGTDTVVVTVFAMNTANAGVDDTLCTGTCTNLSASGGVSYQWTADPSFVGATNIANPQACPTTTTTYTVTVTDINGCVGTDQVTIFVAPTPLATTITSSDNTCFGACNGSATANPTGGYTPYIYLWSNAATGQTAGSLCAGPYSVTVTDNIGCTATANVTITEPTAVLITATNIVTANCGLNDGSVTISVTGGTGAYTILWPVSGNSGLTESNLSPGNVCVYAYDANGCGDTLCVNVPNTPGAAVAITSFFNINCFNACDGIAVATAQGGTGPYSFSWNSSPAQINDTASALCPGTFTVTMTDANGCIDSAVVGLTQPTQLTLVAGTATTICVGQSANLTSTPAGGIGPYVFGWSDGVNVWNTQNITASPTVTTTYSVVATDANGCISPMQTVVVTVNPLLQVTAQAPGIVCAGTLIGLSASATGGDGNYTFTWLPINQIGANVNTTINVTTTYSVVVTDGCGTPFDTAVVTVAVNPAPTVNITATTDLAGCEDLCVTFSNNTPNTATVTWVFGNNLGTSTSNTPTFCFTSAGTYDVTATVTDNIGCVGTTTMANYVTVWPLPIADFSANPQPATILNNSVDFTDLSFGAVSWIWSFGADDSASVLQNPTYAFQDSGVYMVQLIVTNQYGCQDSISLPIIIQEDYALYIPNTFTPNGDTHNDLFFPQGMGINPDKYTMYIFDRWGNMIYQTSQWPGGWDGTVQGTGGVCQVDTYVYKIVTSGPDGNKRQYVGHVNLVR
jgi:large repetitive protein